MAATLDEVSSYTVSLYLKDGLFGAQVVCRTLSSHSVYIRFYREGVALPPNRTYNQPSGRTQFYINLPYHQLTPVVDLLRNEKPVWFFFRDEIMDGYLTTSDEPVGEEESP